ncbi:helix-turn-helix domain-containing protein [Streptomyces sp. NPDC057509]|uniref:helix-turn-helix domain-containing protein n=1 Tax=Streptomyces sp. NPDC057509 TaxID=3346152 RepID=UPI00369016B7
MTQSTSGTATAAPLPSPKERRRLREAKSLTEEQVAAAVGVTRATVRAWETGRTSPRGRKREAYARLIGTIDTPAPSPTERKASNATPKPSTEQPKPPPATAATTTAATAEPVEPVEPVAPVAQAEPVEPVAQEKPVASRPPVLVEPEKPASAGPPPPVLVEATGNDAAMASAEPGSGATPEPPAAPPLPAVAPAPVPVAAPVAADEEREATGTGEAPDTDRADGTAGAGGADGADGTAGADRADRANGAGLSPAEAFDALYGHAAAALFHQTYLLTGRRVLSREAVAKAFELAWQRWPEVAVDRDPVGWVRAAAYEHAMSPWRRLRGEHRRLDPPPEAPGQRALLDALLELPPSYRRTLVLHDGVGLGLPETAAETEASTRAAAGRLVTARAAVAQRLPEVAEPDSPDGRSALLHEHLGALARTQPASSLPVPELIRTGSERKAQLWARSAIAFTVLIIGLTLIALATAPRKYETPPSPAQPVGGVPPVGGPQKLTPGDVKLRKKLGDELVHGPARLVPRAG